MKGGRVFLLVFLCCLMAALPAAAQSSPLVAFVNSSGQLIVSSGDGSYRWIITNPGETLAGGYSWSADGDRLLFAVSSNGAISLRSANVAQQSVSEIGTASGQMISASPDGSSLFLQQDDGSYALAALTGGATSALPLSNDPGAHYSGLWSPSAPLVAYWGYAGNSSLAVTDAATQQTIQLDSGRSAPITPLAWLPNGSGLIYRDTSGVLRLADLACLQTNCPANPLESAVSLASADADAASDGTWLYFRSGSSLSAVSLACGDSCDSSAVVIAQNAAPQTALSVAGGTLVYTAYAQNANDPSDREVRTLDVSCVSAPSSCAPQTVLSSAVAGAISADGQFAAAQMSGGLVSLDLSSGQTSYLADTGAPLDGAIWQP